MDEANDEQLRILLQRVARRIRNNRADGAMSDSQLGVLFQLEKASSTPSRLAEHERVSPPSMNRTLNTLENAGLVARSVSPDDARKVLVTITPAGTGLIAETRRLRTAWFTRQLAELSAAERTALEAVIPVLRRIAES
ncbi:MarR family winged helix-turn-helix transcriptional regulator [Lysinimonas soli]|uniref:MarR family winged helix-turn-helix transcriptional regulator n=1 Tax=Lysinimonas soli TaxID=1074233 RepID=A0ABW0NT83_9MICO